MKRESHGTAQYVDFVAHDWRNGRVSTISTDPCATTNYFQTDNNSLPFELSPAFFKPEVLSRLGKRLVDNQDTYFFHDVSTYSELLQKQIPSIDSVTLLYLKEALQSFRSGCILSSSVMLGVAAEHTFELLLDVVRQSSRAARFSSIAKERSLLPKVNKFKTLLDQMDLPPNIKEDLDTHFTGIISIIRTFRNQSGHPTGQIIDREQAYVLLNLFVPYGKKMYQLMDYFRK